MWIFCTQKSFTHGFSIRWWHWLNQLCAGVFAKWWLPNSIISSLFISWHFSGEDKLKPGFLTVTHHNLKSRKSSPASTTVSMCTMLSLFPSPPLSFPPTAPFTEHLFPALWWVLYVHQIIQLLLTPLEGRSFQSHFADEETETQRSNLPKVIH